MKPSIAFFDFDGTITRKDTLFEIIRYQKGVASLYIGLILLSPALILFKLKLVSNQKIKQLILQYFFRNTPENVFRERCADFCRERLPTLVRDSALNAIRQHLAKGHQVNVVTASAQEWVAPWCESVGIGCIGTRLEVKDARITGRIYGVNCNGEEKVNRIREQFDLSRFDEVHAYGDTSGDQPMLKMATFGYFRRF
ncbi:HAD-superfamily subfamily IB hydrolase, TIGR01490 [Chitinophaga sp. CF118]|uniref:HAD-IB family hydrolase n=1 Tax=Chitinophaga sp. CF118 TaxID=1884367 RepID=UPI0008F3046D|nr:HAD-IB family hydrolase [Chitinophaga sp. CF118]SFE53110.1 HAD-superfamily subfamily IB hydrolase, TIGR01490 [Chitinophaga sp. CF118]